MRRELLLIAILSVSLTAGCASSTASTQKTSEAKPVTTVDKEEASKPANEGRPLMDGIPVLSWQQVSAALEGGAMLVDARGPKGYANGHIVGAVNVPCTAGDEVFAQLSEDKSKQIIFYCSGPACAASSKGAQKALSLGYTNLAEYRGGYPEWHAMQHQQNVAQ